MISEYGMSIYEQIKLGGQLSLQSTAVCCGLKMARSYPIQSEEDFVNAIKDICNNNSMDLDVSVFAVYEHAGSWFRNEFKLLDCLHNVKPLRPNRYR
jgi:hypothetical protein